MPSLFYVSLLVGLTVVAGIVAVLRRNDKDRVVMTEEPAPAEGVVTLPNDQAVPLPARIDEETKEFVLPKKKRTPYERKKALRKKARKAPGKKK